MYSRHRGVKMPKTSKLKVFLSSALDDDVRAERVAAMEGVNHRPYYAEFIGVERWNATALSARENSIAKLAECDVYVGIFGRRCGPVTLEEYEYARAHRMACLLFFRELSADPTPAEDAVGQARVTGIRTGALTVDSPTAKVYSNPADMRFLVTDALDEHWHNLQASEPRQPDSDGSPQPWLVTLCDRDAQQPHVDRMISSFLANPKRTVLVYALSGAEEEDHESLVEWYHLLRLHPDYEPPSGKRRNEALADTRHDPLIRLEWRKPEDSPDERYASLISEFAGQLVATDESNEQKLADVIARALSGAEQHITVRYNVRRNDLRKDDPQLLKRWLEFLLQVPLTTERHVVSVFFCFQREPGLFSRFSRGAGWLQSCIDMMKDIRLPGIVVLPDLSPPTRDHAAVWAETRCLRHFPALDRDVLKRRAIEPFARLKKDEIPFGVIKPDLETALDDAFRAYREPRLGARPQEKP